MIDFLFTKTPLYFMTQSFWRDEGFSYYMAHMSIVQMIQTTAKDFNPPLYYLVLHFWMNVFGSSEIALRSLSFIFYVSTIYVFYIFVRNVLKVTSKARMFFYILLLALNPIVLYYAFEVRMYTLVGLLSTLSFYFFFQKKWLLYVLITILGLYTHYYFIFVVISQGISILFMYKTRRITTLKFPVISLAFLVPWLIYISTWFFGQTQSFWMEKLTINRFLTLPGILLTGYESSKYYQYYDKEINVFTGILIILIAILIYYSRKHFDKKILAIALWSFLGYFIVGTISLVKPIFVPRYLIFCSIGFTIFIVMLLEKVSSRMRVVIISVLLIMIVHYTAYEVHFKIKGDLRATIHQIAHIADKKDMLYVTDAGNYFVASYYFGENRVFVYEKRERIPSYVGVAAIPENKITQKLPPYPQKAFILTSDYDYEIKTALY